MKVIKAEKDYFIASIDIAPNEDNTSFTIMKDNIIKQINSLPPACQNCPNHPSNGGSCNCNCTLGQQVTC